MREILKSLMRAGLLLALPAAALGQSTPPVQSQAPPPAAPSSTAPSAPSSTAPGAPASAPNAANGQELPDSPTQQQPAPQPTGPTAVLDTTMGRITCRLFSREAPQAVANFVGLAEGTKTWTDPTTHEKVTGKPFYNGTQFHRVIPGFMIQGGDPTATGMGDPGYAFDDEIDPALTFDVPGRLAMANSGPNTNGSQFFITEAPQPSLDGKYTIFGQCDDPSVDVVKSIARVERDPNDKPLEPVTLTKVTIVPEGQPLPAPPAGAPAAAPAGQPGTTASQPASPASNPNPQR